MGKPNKNFQTSVGERFSYYSYFFGQNLFYTIVASYVSVFLLNMGFDEKIAALVLIAPQIWGALNDIIFGVLVDKIKFKKGRFLPWLRISWIAIPLATIFVFSMPQAMGQGAKCVWILVGYTLWSIAYTIGDAPAFALSTSMSEDVFERTSILSLGRVLGTVGCIVATLGIEAIYMQLGWRVLAIGLSIAAMLFMLPILITGKERSHAAIERNPKLREVISGFIHNKYLLIFYISFFLIGLTNSVQIIIPIFSQYVLGDTNEGTILLAMALFPAIVIACFIPQLSKRFDKFQMYIVFLLVFAAVSILQFFTGYENKIALNITMAFRGAGLVGFNVLAYLFTPDCVEYGQYKNGIRQEGVCFAIQTFATKLVNAAVNALSLAVLAWLGFSAADADAVTGIVDKAEGLACWGTMTWFCAIGTVVAIPVLLLCYKLRDRDVDQMAKYNNGEISKEECEQRLSRKY
jgi:Na+/melibiose symporter-like transporter